LPWQRGLVVDRSRIYLASSDSLTLKIPCYTKNFRDICYISRVIAVFVPNSVAMATGVGRGRIWLASFNSPTLKTPLSDANIYEISLIQAEL